MNLYGSCLVQLLAVVVLQLAAGLHPTPHPKIYTFQKVAEFPHDHMAFTQGAQATCMRNPSPAHQHLSGPSSHDSSALPPDTAGYRNVCFPGLRRPGV